MLVTKKPENTNHTTINITRHNHNNYEHNVIKNINTYIKHIDNYDTDITYYNKKSFNNNNYYNLYHDISNVRKNEHVSLSQQTDITNNIIETTTQTRTYIDDNYLNNNKIATVILHPTPSVNENYVWTPEVSDNVAPGLDSMITYIQPTYATLTELQHAIANINNIIQTESNNLEIPNQGKVNVNKELYYNTTSYRL